MAQIQAGRNAGEAVAGMSFGSDGTPNGSEQTPNGLESTAATFDCQTSFEPVTVTGF